MDDTLKSEDKTLRGGDGKRVPVERGAEAAGVAAAALGGRGQVLGQVGQLAGGGRTGHAAAAGAGARGGLSPAGDAAQPPGVPGRGGGDARVGRVRRRGGDSGCYLAAGGVRAKPQPEKG